MTCRFGKPSRFASASLAFLALLAPRSLGAAGGAIPYERRESRDRMWPPVRQRVVDRTLLYAETIFGYSHFQNFLHYWIDRPLFTSRSLRPDLAKRYRTDTRESFLLSQRDALACGLDGLAAFGNFSTRLRSFRQHCEWVEESGLPGFGILPVVLYGEYGMDGMPPLEKFSEFILYAQSSRLTPEINGRKLIATYNTRRQDVAAHRRICKALRERVGNDRYLLVGDYEDREIARLRQAFYRNGSLDGAEKARLVEMTTDLLDTFDGLDLRPYDFRRTPDGPYASAVDMSFFDSCVKPVLLDVYARPEYRGKLFGMYVLQGYVNCHSGMTHSEDGTATLRRMLHSVAELNPDFLVLFEWNEQNENTMFQPTLYSGRSVGRIVKWYADFVNGRPPAPYPGDDPSAPGLVLSHRVTYKPGEKIRFEILNVPCGESVREHTAQLSLTDEAGKTLLRFPAETFGTDRLASVGYAVPGETFPVGSSISCVLTVDGRRWDGFHPIRNDATVCRNYKEVRQSLRDGLGVTAPALRVTRLGDGVYRCESEVALKDPDERLASLEMVLNEDEVAAFDPSGEFDAGRYDIIQLAFTTAPGTSGPGQIELAFRDAGGMEISQNWLSAVNPGEVRWMEPGKALLDTFWWTWPTAYFLKFPKGRVGAASVEVKAVGGRHMSDRDVTVPLGRVMETGAYASEISSATGLRVDAMRVRNLPDLPKEPDVASARWTCEVRSSEPNPTFHLRAISRSGKTWRSQGVRPPKDGPEGALEDLPVFSEWRRRPVALGVPSGDIRELSYRFSPDCGDVLACSDPRFNATLGGGYSSDGAFEAPGLLKDAPDRALAPKWAEEGGRWHLRFDGVNDYVAFPAEAVPLGAFTLRMEIRPEANPTNMVIFRHDANRRGTIALFIVGGELHAIWPPRVFPHGAKGCERIQTGLKVKPGAWSDVEVSYDCATLAFRVGGDCRAFPLAERGYRFSPSVFGGHVRRDDIAPPGPLDWFKGDLRAFSIRHNANGGGGK